MSDILAVAVGKTADLPPLHYSTTIDSLLMTEDFRREATVTADDINYNETTCSAASDDSCHSDTSVVRETYISYNGFNGSSSSPPSFLYGDFYNLSPPTTLGLGLQKPSCQTTPYKPRRLSFSIDAILGNNKQDNLSDQRPADVSSFTEGAFSLDDWNLFQRYRSLKRASSLKNSVSRALYWCHACEDTCSDASDADAHQHFHASNCDTCKLQSEFFSETGYVSVHSGTSHWNKVTCGICQQIVFRHFFSRHVKSHDGHICSVCRQEFPTRARLHDHLNEHIALKQHSCKCCDLSFSDRRQLAAHTRRHRPCVHPCNFCGKSFRTKYACAIHERIHTGQKPYACQAPGCTKAFAQRIQLRLHMKIHYK